MLVVAISFIATFTMSMLGRLSRGKTFIVLIVIAAVVAVTLSIIFSNNLYMFPITTMLLVALGAIFGVGVAGEINNRNK